MPPSVADRGAQRLGNLRRSACVGGRLNRRSAVHDMQVIFVKILAG
jgi:hypothetical protein